MGYLQPKAATGPLVKQIQGNIKPLSASILWLQWNWHFYEPDTFVLIFKIKPIEQEIIWYIEKIF